MTVTLLGAKQTDNDLVNSFLYEGYRVSIKVVTSKGSVTENIERASLFGLHNRCRKTSC